MDAEQLPITLFQAKAVVEMLPASYKLLIIFKDSVSLRGVNAEIVLRMANFQERSAASSKVGQQGSAYGSPLSHLRQIGHMRFCVRHGDKFVHGGFRHQKKVDVIM